MTQEDAIEMTPKIQGQHNSIITLSIALFAHSVTSGNIQRIPSVLSICISGLLNFEFQIMFERFGECDKHSTHHPRAELEAYCPSCHRPGSIHALFDIFIRQKVHLLQ